MKKHPLILAGVLTSGALLAGGRVLRAGNDEPTQLRSQGPAGLEKFWNAHKSEIEVHNSKLRAANYSTDAGWRLLSEQLDAVAGQHDAWSSHLYWFTDLEAAKSAAKAQHKPILSLRMLGKLTDEYSCANSRFFRTALYANTQISQTLRNKYILFWSSERPVPVVTIDMGDGRVVKRTLTGNSAHYLLDSAGRPLDVLPGLYGPGAFEAWLEKGEALFKECDGLDSAERGEKLKAWHDAQLGALADAYISDNKAQSPTIQFPANFREGLLKSLRNMAILETQVTTAVVAPIAGRMAVTKTVAEMPLLNATDLYRGDSQFSRGQILYWPGLAPHLADAHLDASSLQLLKSQKAPLNNSSLAQNPISQTNFIPGGFVLNRAGRAQSVAPPTDPFTRLVDNFERNMALDTTRNEWNMHAPLHQWFATHEVNDFDALNRMIYDKLFLTPKSDAWLGLSPAGTYTGLNDGGLFEDSNAMRQAKAN